MTAEVVIELDGGQQIVSVITAESVHNLGLVPGSRAKAIVKATEVMLATDD